MESLTKQHTKKNKKKDKRKDKEKELAKATVDGAELSEVKVEVTCNHTNQQSQVLYCC